MRFRFRFEKLGVWQDARAITRAICRLPQTFPSDEMFAMTGQAQQAAISISSNVAEGSGRNWDRYFDDLDRLAQRIAPVNRTLAVEMSKPPFRRHNSQVLNS